jgi:hypothetical protein
VDVDGDGEADASLRIDDDQSGFGNFALQARAG